jgi:SAM-dependent methyltransferase
MKKPLPNKLDYDRQVLKEFLEKQPPHLSMARAIEAIYYKPLLPLKGRILDVGCGDGFFAWSVYKRQIINCGIDIEGSLWPEAVRQNNYKEVKVYDGVHIPYPNGTFDTVVSNCVLEHVENLEDLLEEIHRVLKPGGSFIVTVATNKWGSKLLGTRLFGQRYSNWFNHKAVHRSNLSLERWKEVYQEAGFKIKNIEGYFSDQNTLYWLDITHYWGIINLMTRKILGNWTWGIAGISNKIWGLVFNRMHFFESHEIESAGCIFIHAVK